MNIFFCEYEFGFINYFKGFACFLDNFFAKSGVELETGDNKLYNRIRALGNEKQWMREEQSNIYI